MARAALVLSCVLSPPLGLVIGLIAAAFLSQRVYVDESALLAGAATPGPSYGIALNVSKLRSAGRLRKRLIRLGVPAEVHEQRPDPGAEAHVSGLTSPAMGAAAAWLDAPQPPPWLPAIPPHDVLWRFQAIIRPWANAATLRGARQALASGKRKIFCM